MSSIPLPNNVSKITMTGNLDLYGNLNLNSQNVYLGYLAGNTNPGGGTLVNNMKNVAIGASCATYQTGLNNVSIGYDAATNGTTTYTGANNVSIGYNSGFNSGFASTSNGVAIGVNSLIDFSGSIAIGSSATATGFRNIAIGSSATSSGTLSVGNSIAIGVGASTVSYGNAVAIGPGATCTTTHQIALGASNCFYSFPPLTNQVFTCSTDTDYTWTTGGTRKIPFTTLNNIDTSLITYSNAVFTVQKDMVLAIYFSAYFIDTTASADNPFVGVFIDTADAYRYGQNTLTNIENLELGVSTVAFLSLSKNNTFSCSIVYNNGVATFTKGYATIFCLY
jgi:hypothetical protein